MDKKYKEGDNVILSYCRYENREVRRITGWSQLYPNIYGILNHINNDGHHQNTCYENNIEGLYNGKIDIDGDVWEPKYAIGDTVLVHVEDFGDKPTWHTIYHLEYSSGVHFISKESYSKRFYNVSGGNLVAEEDILDVIRYGETK